MTNKQSNFIAMIMAVQKVFAKYPEEVAGLLALAGVVENLNGLQKETSEVLQIQQGKITGISLQKQKEEAEMIEETVRVAGACYVYAIDNSNFELLEKVGVNAYELERMPQAKLQAICNTVLTEAQKLDGKLTNYGVATEGISKLRKEIKDYTELVANPRAAIVTRSQATKRLGELVKVQRDLLNQKADKLMLSFKTSNAPFYNEYKAARIIVDMGIRHKKEETEE